MASPLDGKVDRSRCLVVHDPSSWNIRLPLELDDSFSRRVSKEVQAQLNRIYRIAERAQLIVEVGNVISLGI
jgi:hypothetical protein